MAEDKEKSEKVNAFLQELGPGGIKDSAVLTGWVLVAEWMDEEGEKWISKGCADNLTTWAANGFLHEALYGNWKTREELE